MSARRSAELLALCKDSLSAAGEAEAEIVVRTRTRGCARFAVSELGQHMALEEAEARVRVADRGRVAEVTTTDASKDALAAAVRSAAALAKRAPETPGWPGFARADAGPLPKVERWSDATANATDELRASIVARIIERIRSEGFVSAGILETAASSVAVATTGGAARAHDGTFAELRVWALADAGGKGASGHGSHLCRDVDALAVDVATEDAIRIAKDGRDPGSADAGTWDVVMEPPAVAELLEWLGMIGLGAPEIETGTSFLAGRFGERVTGDRITLVEDPCAAHEGAIAEPFDREGVPRRRVVIVEKGIARSGLYDRLHGARAGHPSTGSALVPDFGAPGGVGGVGLELEGGDAEDVDELVRGLDRGLYIRRLNYVNGFVEPRRAVMTGLSRDGCFLVEKGKVGRAVGNVRMTDSFLEMLARADGMTRARRAISAAWTSGGSFYVPAIRFRGVRFTSGSAKRG